MTARRYIYRSGQHPDRYLDGDTMAALDTGGLMRFCCECSGPGVDVFHPDDCAETCPTCQLPTRAGDTCPRCPITKG